MATMSEKVGAFWKTLKRKPFVVRPRYFPVGDFLTLLIREERCYEERVDELVTAYRTIDGHELAGLKIKCVSTMLQELAEFGVIAAEEDICIGVFLFALARNAEPEPKAKYREMGRTFGQQSVPVSRIREAVCA